MTRRPISIATTTTTSVNVADSLGRALTNMLMAHGACEEREIELRARVSEWDFYRLYAKLAALVPQHAFTQCSTYQHRCVLSAGDLRSEYCCATQRYLGSHRKQRLAHVDFNLPWSSTADGAVPTASVLRLSVASEFPACDARVADTPAAYRREKLRLSLRLCPLCPRWRVDFTIVASPSAAVLEYEVEIEFLHNVEPGVVVYESVEQLVAQALHICRGLEFC